MGTRLLGGGHPEVTLSLLLWPAVIAALYGLALSYVVTAVAECNVVLTVSPRRASWAVEALDGSRRIRLGAAGRATIVAGLGLGLAPVILADVSSTVVIYDGALLCALVALSIVDAWEYRIPDRIVLPAIGATAMLAVAVSVGMAADTGLAAIDGLHPRSALVGAGCFALLIGVPHVMRPDAMGLGDVKLAVLLGAAIGLHRSDLMETVAAVGWAVALAAIVGLVAAVSNRGAGQRGVVPFGPPLSLGAWLVILASL